MPTYKTCLWMYTHQIAATIKREGIIRIIQEILILYPFTKIQFFIITVWITLKEETFALQKNREIFTFRGNKLSRMKSYEKFRGNKLSWWTTFKRFYGNKKVEILNLWEETFVFIVLWLRCGTWPVLKSLKKSFKKLIFHYSFFLSFFFEILRMPQ